jgi:hypothetical protein
MPPHGQACFLTAKSTGSHRLLRATNHDVSPSHSNYANWLRRHCRRHLKTDLKFIFRKARLWSEMILGECCLTIVTAVIDVGRWCSVLEIRSGHVCGSHLVAKNSLLAAWFWWWRKFVYTDSPPHTQFQDRQFQTYGIFKKSKIDII